VKLVPLLDGVRSPLNDHPAAVTVAGRSLDVEGLGEAAGAVAARIAALPVVAVEATATLETVVAVLGGLAAGVPVTPVPPDAGLLERTHILRDCAAPVLLAGAGSYPEISKLIKGVEVLPVRLDEPASGRPPAPAPSRPDNAAFILYTSGTTGPPKGVILSADAIAADLDLLAEAWAWTPEDVLVHGLPLFHAHGLIQGVIGALRALPGMPRWSDTE
jgi:fatty acid CoA ligase FadD36